MEINFYKYQGTGNDFIMIDDREEKTELSNLQIQMLCDRKTGVGADGLILLRSHKQHDFEMIYYNSDASQSFCGNGSRCSIAFADKLHMISNNTSFVAFDGMHEGKIEGNLIAVKMNDVSTIEEKGRDLFLNTGSPHYIKWVEDIEKVNVLIEGNQIRNSEEYKKTGTNVNFASIEGGKIHVRTYERGVEDETLSCGTGVTAVALAASYLNRKTGQQQQSIYTKGGEITVRFEANDNGNFENIWLVGPAEMVFQGKIFI